MVRRRNSLSKISLLSAVFLLYLGNNLSPVHISLSDSLGSANRSISQSYAVHNPILITDDGALAAVANSGVGAANDPYIIADWNITGSTTNGIFITGTTKHFRIENCWIVNSVNCGIYVDNVPTGTTTITNTTCSNNFENGIYLETSGSLIITNNTCNSNRFSGISLQDSGYSTLANNTCNNNRGDGITLRYSSFSTVANNTCNSNIENGISLGTSSSSTITSNTCNSNNHNGIFLSNSGYSTITSNTCNSNDDYGIYISDSSSSNITNNTCNDNFENGIYLETSGSSIIVNNTCNDNFENGIYLETSGSSIIVNTTCNSNRFSGISLQDSGYSILTKNTCNNNIIGIDIDNSDSLNVTKNTCNSNNGDGIYLHNSNNYLFDRNILVENFDGIQLQSCTNVIMSENFVVKNEWSGIRVKDSNYITINNNSIVLNGASENTGEDSGSTGISVVASTDGWISGNLISNNKIVAMDLFYSRNFTITGNNFINNMRGLPEDNMSQVYEYTSSPEEQNNFTRNFWDEWIVPDGNTDGIVDEPYIIGGDSNNNDPFPLTDFIFQDPQSIHLFFSPWIIFSEENGIFDVTILINWTEAIDTHNHPITYTLYYSLNNGSTWGIIESNLTSTGYPWTISNVGDSSSCLFKVVAICSEGFTTTSTERYHFYIFGPPTIEISKPPPTIAYSGESFVCSLSIVNNELLPLNLTLMVFGQTDDVLEGNFTQILISPGEQGNVDLKIRPKHASSHQLNISIFYEEFLYYQIILSFNVNPQWMSPSSILLIIELSVILFITIIFVLYVRKHQQLSTQFWEYHTQLNQLIEKLTISNLEVAIKEAQANGSDDPSYHLLGFPQGLFQQEPLDREALKLEFHSLRDQIEQGDPSNREKLSKLLQDVEKLLF